MLDLRGAAERYAARNITVCPLGLDADGIAKVPLSDSYPRFRPGMNAQHDWTDAKGLGIVLGHPSGNLAAVDIDDKGLADWLGARLALMVKPPLMVSTARKRLHVYVTEPAPSKPVDLEVRYQGRKCLVQLLASSVCQAAAPPTPGYAWVSTRAEPLYGAVREVWHQMSLKYGLPYRVATPYSFLRQERSRGPSTAQIREAPDVGR